MSITKTLLLLVVLMPVMALAQKLELTGTLTGLADGTPIVLTDFMGNASPLATTKSKNGRFSLSCSLEGPTLIKFTAGDNNKASIFVSNEKVTLTGKADEKPELWKYTGSVLQQDFISFEKIFIPQFAAFNALSLQLQNTGADSTRQQLQNSISNIQNSIARFIQERPASPVSVLLLLSTIGLTDDITLLEKRANALQPAAYNNVFGGQLKQAIVAAKFNAVGSMSLDFSQKDINGKTVSLSQFRGQYVLVDFWASWCGPCRRENHFLVKTYEKFKNKNFTVLGVSLDEDRDKWMQAIKKDALPWTQVSDLQGWNNEVAQQYKITAIPRNLLIAPDGKILAKDLRSDALDAKLEAILGK